jgi:hypothetical protein
MSRTFIQLAVVSIALAIVGPALAGQRSTTASASPEVAPQAQPTPVAAQAADLLCGLSQGDVADIIDHYDLAPNMAAFAAALEVPFDCEAYGGLCSALGVDHAHGYACGVWLRLEAHDPFVEIAESAIERLGMWGTPCPANEAVCEEMCDPYAVTECSGLVYHGSCHQIPQCDLMSEIPFFEDVVVLP